MRTTLHSRRARSVPALPAVACALCAVPLLAASAVIAQAPRDAQQQRQQQQRQQEQRAAPMDYPMRSDIAQWETVTPMPDRRTEIAATTCGRFIYVAGGLGPPENQQEVDDPLDLTQAPQQATAPRMVWRYDPRHDEWVAITELPQGIHHAPFQYYEGRLYLLGGFRENTFEPVPAVRIYHIADNEWTQGASMPTPRGASGWAVLHGRIHVIGGNVAEPEAVEGQPGIEVTEDNSVNTHEAYDPATNTWERLAPMPTPRNHTGAAAVDGRIHVVLGRVNDEHFTMTTHEIYDPARDRWTVGPDVPTGRSGVAVLEHAGYMYTFGGETLKEGNERTFDNAERFNPRTNRWEILPAMPTARHGLGATAVGNAIYVISGGPGPAFTFGDANERLILTRDPVGWERPAIGMR